MRSRLNELIAGAGITDKIVRPPRRRRMAGKPNAPATSKSSPRNGPWSTARVSSSSGSRAAAEFALLPADVREAALQSLADWAEESIGPLDRPIGELHHFALKLYWFEGGQRMNEFSHRLASASPDQAIAGGIAQ